METPLAAIGDKQGKVILLHDVCNETTTRSHHHWHAQGVKCVALSPDGAYMLSGGAENVVVVTQLATGVRTFLPRLGAEVTAVLSSRDGQVYAAATADHTVRFLRAAGLQLISETHGVARDGTQPDVLTIDPRAGPGVVVFPAGRGAVQWYHARHGRHVAMLQATNVAPHGLPAHVTHVAFNRTGTAMAIAEQRGEPGDTTTAVSFWRYQADTQTFKLITRVENPHKHPLSSIAFHPTRNECATAAPDGRVHIWRSNGTTWSCRASLTYRSLPVTYLAYNNDGSVLAFAAANSVTLWSPESLTLLEVLSTSPPNEQLRWITFVQDDAVLVAASRSHVYVWDLCNMHVRWSIAMHVTTLVAGGAREFFVASVSRIVAFKTDKTHPTSIIRCSHWPVALAYDGESLLYLDNGDNINVAGASGREVLIVESKPTPQPSVSLFGQVYGATAPTKKATKQSESELKPEVALHNPQHTSISVLDAPTHVLPAATALFGPYMRLRMRKPTTLQAQTVNNIETKDIAMEDHMETSLQDTAETVGAATVELNDLSLNQSMVTFFCETIY